jgi:hypothetical protein
MHIKGGLALVLRNPCNPIPLLGHSFVLYSGQHQLRSLTLDLILMACHREFFCLCTVAPNLYDQLERAIDDLGKSFALDLNQIRIRELAEEEINNKNYLKSIATDIWELMQTGRPSVHIVHYHQNFWACLSDLINHERTTTKVIKHRPVGTIGLYCAETFYNRLETLFSLHQFYSEGEEIHRACENLRFSLLGREA